MSKTLFITSALYLLSHNAFAQECAINFNYGVIIDPNHIRIVEQSKTQVQINNEHQLFIQGRELALSSEQQQLLAQFSAGIRQQLPEMVSIAIEGVDIGLKAANEVIGGLTGENSSSQQKVQAKFDELKWRIRARFNQSANNYYIAPQDFNDFDEMFAGEFEQEIEEIISNSIGTILKAVGQSLLAEGSHDETGNGEQRIATFDQRLTGIEQGLQLEVTQRAKALDEKASLFCLQLTALDQIEHDLHKVIPELALYNIIETKN
ncbi:YggN family protein [Colwellia sp. D2M02]|uniref:DUF2884 family protein n=1 Tax=Colwellia sp. D2M02 TaxID=2841562 RepID=UPI001C08FB35|nr:DUF2884 family protein [Colwellia sp. D2M02]MBU2894028.1 YggN family protein [Colwellia sp. D2M02]